MKTLLSLIRRFGNYCESTYSLAPTDSKPWFLTGLLLGACSVLAAAIILISHLIYWTGSVLTAVANTFVFFSGIILFVGAVIFALVGGGVFVYNKYISRWIESYKNAKEQDW